MDCPNFIVVRGTVQWEAKESHQRRDNRGKGAEVIPWNACSLILYCAPLQCFHPRIFASGLGVCKAAGGAGSMCASFHRPPWANGEEQPDAARPDTGSDVAANDK
mmetsp:Transcript_62917/g.124379  ORF Transcript_62917/g.124379 Transcript_62917/m.124379 type:complete len:105 (+) Transcript_62917:125-439(+)